jgi:hypothetical protein
MVQPWWKGLFYDLTTYVRKFQNQLIIFGLMMQCLSANCPTGVMRQSEIEQRHRSIQVHSNQTHSATPSKSLQSQMA